MKDRIESCKFCGVITNIEYSGNWSRNPPYKEIHWRCPVCKNINIRK